MSSAVLQKHVGQTIVQLPQLRQRSATSSQRGCSALPTSRSRMPSVSRRRPIEAAVRSVCSPASRRSPAAAGRAGSSASTSLPALAAGLDEEAVPVVVDAARSARGRARPVTARAGVHRDAEARPARAGAVDRHEEGVRGDGPRSPGRRSGRRGRRGPGSRPRAGRTSGRRGRRNAAGAAAARRRASRPAPRRARQTRTTGGNRKRLTESCPTVWANSAPSSRRRSR